MSVIGIFKKQLGPLLGLSATANSTCTDELKVLRLKSPLHTFPQCPNRASVSCATDEPNGSTQEAIWHTYPFLSNRNHRNRKTLPIALIQTAKAAKLVPRNRVAPATTSQRDNLDPTHQKAPFRTPGSATGTKVRGTLTAIEESEAGSFAFRRRFGNCLQPILLLSGTHIVWRHPIRANLFGRSMPQGRKLDLETIRAALNIVCPHRRA
jgi:hypothetical protein